ncbi:MAG: hypothetical protein AB8G99_06630 [Planctomycetaceae bacterium]
MSSFARFGALILAVALLAGCTGSETDTAAVSSTTSEAADGDDHDHAHDHPSEGPHHGDLIELGHDEYHAELLHPEHEEDHSDRRDDESHATDVITVYVLDSSATKTVAIEAAEVTLNLMHDGKPAQFKLPAQPTEADAGGKSSRFSSNDKELLGHFHDSDHMDGTLVVTINGKSYRGDLAHDHGDSHQH